MNHRRRSGPTRRAPFRELPRERANTTRSLECPAPVLYLINTPLPGAIWSNRSLFCDRDMLIAKQVVNAIKGLAVPPPVGQHSGAYTSVCPTRLPEDKLNCPQAITGAMRFPWNSFKYFSPSFQGRWTSHVSPRPECKTG
jgi:hypothetical protein